jgi:hypothetical protein
LNITRLKSKHFCARLVPNLEHVGDVLRGFCDTSATMFRQMNIHPDERSS